MPTATVNGIELYYELLGEGPPCLVLHGGLGLDHTYFRPAFDRLAARVRLVYFDQRGNGRSARPPLATLSIEQLADDAAALCDHLGLAPAVVVGHSYGGFVAQELAVRHPEAVAALVLVGTTPGQLGASDDPDEPQGAPPPPEVVALVQSPPGDDAAFRATMAALAPWYLHRAEPQVLHDALAGTVFDAATMVRSMELLAQWSVVDRLPDIDVPALVTVGRHDVFCSPEQSARIARRLRHAELVVFDESGHFPWVEEPDAWFRTVEAWLDRRVRPASAVGTGPPPD